MGNSINKVYLIGRLGKDPEVRSTPSGRTVTTLNLATSETYGKDQDKKEVTAWHKIICWDKLGDVAGNYLKKGSQVHVEGKITYRDYVDKKGSQVHVEGKITYRDYVDKKEVKHYVTEIVALSLIFLGKAGGSTASTSNENQPTDPYAGQAQNYQPAADDDDAVPF